MAENYFAPTYNALAGLRESAMVENQANQQKTQNALAQRQMALQEQNALFSQQRQGAELDKYRREMIQNVPLVAQRILDAPPEIQGQTYNAALQMYGIQDAPQWGTPEAINYVKQYAALAPKESPKYSLKDTEKGLVYFPQTPGPEPVETGYKGKPAGGGMAEYPHVARLISQGWYPSSGRLTKPMMEAIEQGAALSEQSGQTFGPKEAWSAEFNAVKNRATGSTAGGRATIARKQNIEAAFGLLKDMEKTAAKLDYSDAKFIGSMERWKNGQLNDPLFTEYMTQRADSLFVLGNALKQNGLTDKSIEVEEEAYNPTLSPKAFKGWYNSQLRALNRAANEMNRDFGYEIHTMPTFPAGQGGAPTPQNPVPTVEGGPRLGMVEDGYRFRGGDPADPNNWEQVQ